MSVLPCSPIVARFPGAGGRVKGARSVPRSGAVGALEAATREWTMGRGRGGKHADVGLESWFVSFLCQGMIRQWRSMKWRQGSQAYLGPRASGPAT